MSGAGTSPEASSCAAFQAATKRAVSRGVIARKVAGGSPVTPQRFEIRAVASYRAGGVTASRPIHPLFF